MAEPIKTNAVACRFPLGAPAAVERSSIVPPPTVKERAAAGLPLSPVMSLPTTNSTSQEGASTIGAFSRSVLPFVPLAAGMDRGRDDDITSVSPYVDR